MKTLLLSGACAASLLLAVTASEQAAGSEIAPEPAGWSWYLSVFGGWSLPDDLEMEFQTFYNTTTWNYNVNHGLEDGFLAGIAVGVKINDRVRGEVEVSGHWNEVSWAEVNLTGPVTTFFDGSSNFAVLQEGDVNALLLLANLWLEFPIREGVRPYVGGGVGIGRLDVNIEYYGGNTAVYGNTVVDDSDWGFAFQGGAGFAVDLSANVAIDLGYRFKAINNVELDLDETFFVSPTDTDSGYHSHNLILGLRWGF